MIELEGDTLPFFRELVERALKQAGRPVGEEVEFYVCMLLVDMGKRSLDEGPFGTRLLSSDEPVVLRSVGDGSLFLSGFFPERIVKKGLSQSYLASVGSSAYELLSSRSPRQVRGMYGELASRFHHLQRVLVGVREMCDVLGLGIGEAAARWLQTGSPVLQRHGAQLSMYLMAKGKA